MSYKKIFLLAVVGLLVVAGCSKDNTTTNDQSTWTIDGVTYTSSSPATFSSNKLAAADNNQNGDIEILFSTKPTMDGFYGVTDLSDTSAVGSSTCSININTPTVQNYKSTGSEMVHVTVNSGKVTATFSNMEMKNNTNSSVASGTIIEK
jgi:hypothetical protein